MSPCHNQWVPIQKQKGSPNWKCLGLYVTRQLIWGQTPKLFVQFAIQGDDRLWSSNNDPLLCLSQNKVMFQLKIILIYDKLLWMLPRGWQLNEGSTVVRSEGFLILKGSLHQLNWKYLSQVSCLAVMENLTQMAVGFADGTVLVYKGDITRDRL